MNELKRDYEKVSSKTNPLHSISLSLSNDQTKLNEIYTDLDHKLSPFLKVDSVIKRLETSAIAVTSDAFLNVLDDIDDCTLYFKEHVSMTRFTTCNIYFAKLIDRILQESFKESAGYLLKTRHCLSRALLDVKSYIISVLDTCKTVPSLVSLSSAPSDENNSDTMKSSKFVAHYGRFQTIASRLKPLLSELETRAEKCSE